MLQPGDRVTYRPSAGEVGVYRDRTAARLPRLVYGHVVRVNADATVATIEVELTTGRVRFPAAVPTLEKGWV